MGLTVLFVDDEEKYRVAFSELMQRKGIAHVVAEDGVQALEVLSKKTLIQVVVADIHMPKMGGVELLEQVAEHYPHTIRIALSAHANKQEVKEALNRGRIWRYLEKPWQPGLLFVFIKNAYELYVERAERLALVQELQQKSDALETLNRELEQTVAKRTWQLEQRTRILDLVVRNGSVERVLSEVAIVLMESASLASLSIESPHLDTLFTHDEPERVAGSFVLNVPLYKDAEKLGMIRATLAADIAPGAIPQEEERAEKNISYFAGLVSMSLAQAQLLADIPGLITDLDVLIGQIE